MRDDIVGVDVDDVMRWSPVVRRFSKLLPILGTLRDLMFGLCLGGGALVCAHASLALSREMDRMRPIDPPVHLRLGDGRACLLAA